MTAEVPSIAAATRVDAAPFWPLSPAALSTASFAPRMAAASASAGACPARERRARRRVLAHDGASAALPLAGSPRDVREARGLERTDRIGELLPDDIRRP